MYTWVTWGFAWLHPSIIISSNTSLSYIICIPCFMVNLSQRKSPLCSSPVLPRVPSLSTSGPIYRKGKPTGNYVFLHVFYHHPLGKLGNQLNGCACNMSTRRNVAMIKLWITYKSETILYGPCFSRGFIYIYIYGFMNLHIFGTMKYKLCCQMRVTRWFW